MIGRRVGAVVACVAASGAVVLAASNIRITPIPSEGRVKVTFTARDAWTQDTREVLQTGMQVMFDYEVYLKRPTPLGLFDPVLARAHLQSIAEFDTLAGDYKVTRMRSGTVVKSERRKLEVEVRDWLTTFDPFVLDPVEPLEPNAEYYVKIVLTTRPQRSVSFWSVLGLGREENVGRETFTYIK